MTQLFASVVRDLAKTILPSGRHTRIYEIHSKRTMDARTNTSNTFRADKSGASILISSDVSARGVDYPGVSRVIQVGIPSTPDQYVHRVGRTGRAGTKGRGDLVLLPWELHYVTSMLSDLPLKPLKYADLTREVLGLAKKFDANPQEFFAQAPWAPATSTRVTGRREMPVTGPSMFQHPVTLKLEDVESDITKLVGQFDGEAIRETFMSLLGYYVVRCGDLRLTKEALMDGLRAWSTDACGLSVPPYVSASFLQRIGLGERSMRSGMRGGHKQYGNSSREGRGRQASWGMSEGGDRVSRGGRSDGSGYGGRGGQGGRDSYSQGSRGGFDQGGRTGYGSSGRSGYSQRGRGGYGQGGGGYGQGGGGYGQGGGYSGGRGREGASGELGRGVA
jgi:ATP-dependent RNA helicase MSS116